MINRESVVSSYNADLGLHNTSHTLPPSPKDKIELVANVLHDVAIGRSMYPIHCQSAIYKEMDHDLADWLLRFIVNPLGTFRSHRLRPWTSHTHLVRSIIATAHDACIWIQYIKTTKNRSHLSTHARLGISQGPAGLLSAKAQARPSPPHCVFELCFARLRHHQGD